MWSSLQKLLALPSTTQLYCAHEYTQANARFALTVEPDNEALRARAREVDVLRAAQRPTVPTTLALEMATNPFLRPSSADLRRTIGMPAAPDVDVFARTRALKDAF
jgi:hydroxyacylglutathione hydrolase